MTVPHLVEAHVNEAFEERVDVALIAQTVTTVLSQLGTSEPVEVSILITDDAMLQQLNRDYRGVDAPTDVLSFGEDDDEPVQPFVNAPDASQRYLGDIAISYERVQAQAAAYGHSERRELAYLVAHGVLHLLGYDHERSEAEAATMRTLEEAAMEALGLSLG
ncbi:MAG: rRNA maturation RNase YbeY [Chloroflexaceae bacterium]|nr:rRNA maturation RNase YbeY [Chloroflexaceae bacterium]NJO06469.1 rRNA maturation RNase YbeY [Chloroflexaceae bacterium]